MVCSRDVTLVLILLLATVHLHECSSRAFVSEKAMQVRALEIRNVHRCRFMCTYGILQRTYEILQFEYGIYEVLFA
jgi:hypothetical protein